MSGFKVRLDLRKNNQSRLLARKLHMAERNCAHVLCHWAMPAIDPSDYAMIRMNFGSPYVRMFARPLSYNMCITD